MNLETQISSELWAVVRTRWENRDFSGAVLDTMYYLSDLIREKGDLEGDGVPLVGQAFGGSNPRIKVTRLHTESDRNIQAGTEAILRGLYQAIRNPRSHEKIKDTEDDATAIILFIDYMIRVIGEARSIFSEHEFIDRVYDENFVAEKRYAALLVNEIPSKKRLAVCLEVFRNRSHGDGKNLEIFFSELLSLLPENDQSDFFREVSEEFKTLDNETEIRLAVQAIPKEKWQLIEEVARIRIENKFLKSIQAGKYDPRKDKCTHGVLGTWGKNILIQSFLLDKVKSTLINKLGSDDRYERSYVLKYFFSWLCDFPDMPSNELDLAIRYRISEGDIDVKSAAEIQYFMDENRNWSEKTMKAIDEFVEVEPHPDPNDNDLPF